MDTAFYLIPDSGINVIQHLQVEGQTKPNV